MALPQEIPRAERRCPKCERAFLRGQAGAIEIERCLHCQHAWFDGGELELWRAKERAGEEQPIPFGAPQSGEPLRCPSCGTATLRIGSIGNSAAHSCAACGGFLVRFGSGEKAETAVFALDTFVHAFLSALS